MSGGSNCSRLCHLIDDSLRSYTESDVGSVTKEKEREILLALSQVLRQVQLWNQISDSDSDHGSVAELDCEDECSGGCNFHSEEIGCLSRIVTDLVVLLTFKSQYVQHLAGNVLLVLSEFVAISGSNWVAFIHFLCVSVDIAMTISLSNSSAPSTTGVDDTNSGSSSFVLKLKPKLKDADWCAVAAILRVLRNILKYLTRENEVHLIKAYFDSVISFLSNVPGDLLTEIFVVPIGDARKSSQVDALFQRFMFLGNFVQFLCSLVEHSGSAEAKGDSVNNNPLIFVTIHLVPKLLTWCLGEQTVCDNKCISQYLRQKLLVLMIRLSFQTSLDCSVLVLWLQLIHKYFSELLQKPINSHESVKDDCLEDSPFLLSLPGAEVDNLSSFHVQRRVIFLFLRCCFSLISLQGKTDENSACASGNSCLPDNSNFELEYCERNKGLIELYNWLQGHLPTDMFPNHEKCVHFTLSFLRLYMHEDDILFKVLLQLLSLPFSAEEWFQTEKEAANHDMLFHISKLFNPVHLFHLFLAELHYDHQVLLDYLISKDTGISCAEYLLRCLRTVCDSWHLFVEFSVTGELINQSSKKKRKLHSDDSNFQAEGSSTSLKNNKVKRLIEKECGEDYKCGGKHYQTTGNPYKEAKECLLSLKVSVESLHQKNLFPYNPNVLLKRLTRFQELCFEEEQFTFEK